MDGRKIVEVLADLWVGVKILALAACFVYLAGAVAVLYFALLDFLESRP